MDPVRTRSRLPKPDARKRYVEMGELVVLQQIKTDARLLEERAIAVGPFARLDAGAVAALDGKTRGAITNLFGSQAAFQAETMALALNAQDWIERIEYPRPGDFATPDEWVDAFFADQSARGPRHAADPDVDYAFLWALWLSTVPYGIWSEAIAQSTQHEYRQWVAQLERVLAEALDHFAMILRDGTSITDLALATGDLVCGVWLNQCLSTRHPCDPSEPVATSLRRAGRLLWRGAARPRRPDGDPMAGQPG